jgi:hypothetical protein
MKKLTKLPPPRPDRLSYAKHRQDVTRQIILPVAFVAVMVIVLAVLVWVGFVQGGDVGRWASAAIIWMIIPLMFLLLVILALSAGLVALMNRVVEVSPRYTGMIQAYVLLFNEQIILWTDRIIRPILKTKAWLTLFSKEDQ